MPFTLDQVVPWGRSFDEYVDMFALTPADLSTRILGCGDGPAAFNASFTRQGGRVISIDPLYQFPGQAIRDRVTAIAPMMLEQTSKNRDEFVWTRFASPQTLLQARLAAMDDFLCDYELGLKQARYLPAALPALPFPDHHFDLALCSHFLFLYSPHFDAPFHLQSLRELCRVAREARIFPLLELGSKTSRHLHTVTDQLRSLGYQVTLETVNYELQKTGNQMMRIKPPAQ
jgi:hypothetical protein